MFTDSVHIQLIDSVHTRPLDPATQERDRASAVSESASALRMKRSELASKRAELDALLTSKRAALLGLLGVPALPAAVEVGVITLKYVRLAF